MIVARALEERKAMLEGRTSIGASDVAAIVGYDAFRDAGQVYDRVVASLEGRGQHDDTEEIDGQQLRGIVNEPIAVELYTMRTGIKMRRIKQRRHPELPYLHANVDRQVLANGAHSTHPAEVKVPHPATFRRIVEYGLSPAWAIQGQVQLSCFPDYPIVRFVLMEPVNMETYGVVIDRRPELVAALEDAVKRFWRDHVEPRIRPTKFDVELPELPELGGTVEVWDDEETVRFTESWAKLHLINKVAKQAEELRKLASATLCGRMPQDLKTIEVPEVGRFTHVVVKPSKVYDKKALDAHFASVGIDPDDPDAGLKKPKAGFQYIRPTFKPEALERLAGPAREILMEGLQAPDIKQLEEGDG